MFRSWKICLFSVYSKQSPTLDDSVGVNWKYYIYTEKPLIRHITYVAMSTAFQTKNWEKKKYFNTQNLTQKANINKQICQTVLTSKHFQPLDQFTVAWTLE